MTSLDLSAGLSLCRASGWNQTQRDWQMFLAAAPHGALVAEEAGRVIGTVATMPYGPFTWISMVLVDPSARGRGVGTLLLEHGVALVPDHVTARLDATESGEPLYRGLGFVAEYRIARWFVDAPARVTPASGVRPFERADWAAVHALDRRAFGVPRVSLLERLVDDAPEYAVALGEPGDGRAYLFGRHGHDREQLGPLIAGSPEAATALVETCLAHHVDRRFFIDVPQDQHAWTRVVSALGFVVERTFLRMHRGVMRAPGEPALVYAITGPEFG
jgi:ribosomal protein S18 acetylase RimI-like enzyme